MLSNDFKEILDNYANEKSKDFKTSQFALNFREKLVESISKFIDNDDLIVTASCGYINWAENPWINIGHNGFNSSNESLLIYYKFNIESSSISLFIKPKLEEYEDYVSINNLLYKHLKNLNIFDFKICRNNNSFILLYKNYNYDDLDNILLKKDLDIIVGIYNGLCGVFRNYLKNTSNALNKHESIFDNSLFFDENIINENDVLFRRERILYKEITPKINIIDIKTTYLIENSYKNQISDIDEFFTDDVIDKIIKCKININDYNNILEDIKLNNFESLLNIVSLYNLNINELSTRDKVLLYAKSFTNVEYKSVGRVLGSYSFNTIKIDDRLPNPLIITSIIHELSHFLLEKILKEVLMKILDTNDTPLISSYVKILLEDNDLNYLFDEYCAHTVEGRFALYGYQDYSSFKYKLNEISDLYSKEDINYALILGNTFAYDIKNIIEEFIDEDLREKIKDEFLKLSEKPNYEPLDLEIESKIENENFIESLPLILVTGVAECLNQKDKLERYMKKFGN